MHCYICRVHSLLEVLENGVFGIVGARKANINSIGECGKRRQNQKGQQQLSSFQVLSILISFQKLLKSRCIQHTHHIRYVYSMLFESDFLTLIFNISLRYGFFNSFLLSLNSALSILKANFPAFSFLTTGHILISSNSIKKKIV